MLLSLQKGYCNACQFINKQMSHVVTQQITIMMIVLNRKQLHSPREDLLASSARLLLKTHYRRRSEWTEL